MTDKITLRTGGKVTIPPASILQNRVALAFVDNITIMITKMEQWTTKDMYTVMEETGRLGGRIESPCAFTQYFGATFGGDATHRKLIVDWQTANNIPPVKRVVNLTDSTLMRAALTAYLWLSKTDGKAFKPGELDQSCQWITRDLTVKPEQVKDAVLGCYRILGVRL